MGTVGSGPLPQQWWLYLSGPIGLSFIVHEQHDEQRDRGPRAMPSDRLPETLNATPSTAATQPTTRLAV